MIFPSIKIITKIAKLYQFVAFNSLCVFSLLNKLIIMDLFVGSDNDKPKDESENPDVELIPTEPKDPEKTDIPEITPR